MSDNVYANGREFACKAGLGKSICAFPDVCFTPPENPATPPGVPVPYPNTGMDSDTTEGSRTVKISGQEVMLKNKSYFKRSMGDEAGCAAKKGAVTSTNMGKVYFIAWSMDVKVEDENVVRHLDMTTHNHASPVANTGPQIFNARMAMADIPGCEGERANVQTACTPPNGEPKCPSRSKVQGAKRKMSQAKKAWQAKNPGGPKDGFKSDPTYQKEKDEWNAAMDDFAQKVADDPCQRKLRCLLSPYSPSKCCPGQTPHHLVEAGSFYDKGREATDWSWKEDGEVVNPQRPIFGTKKYEQEKAPCICCEGENQHQATHGLMHEHQNQSARDAPKIHHPMYPTMECRTLDNAQKSGVAAAQAVFPESDCDPGCMEAQLKAYHETACDMGPNQPVRAVEA